MRRRINPFFLLYELFIFLPLFLILTTLTAFVTILTTTFLGDTKWNYYPARWWSKLTCILAFVKVETKGKDLVENGKLYIFVANHQSIFDVFLIYGYLDCKFRWIMKNEIKKIPMIGKACESAGHIFIDRNHARSAMHSIEVAAEKLVSGTSVVIFPEGTRTHNGTMHKFHKGAFLLASSLNLPIVPITIRGAYEVLPRDSYIIRPCKISMTLHAPIDTQNYTHDNIHELVKQAYEVIEKDL